MARTALLIVDMLSSYRYEGANSVAENAEAALPAICSARDRADRENWPVVYANDVEGGYHGSREQVWRHAIEGRRPDLVEPLAPRADDAFMHKGRHSAFFETPLGEYLWSERIKRVFLVGQVTEQCILYTAVEAHMRHLEVTVSRDAVAGRDPELEAAAFQMIAMNMNGDVLERVD